MATKQSAQKRRQVMRDDARREPSIVPKNPKQQTYLDALRRFDTVIASGPAGTGKTYLACAHAAQLLQRNGIQRVVLARPPVGTTKTQGFLPGKLEQKLAPWARPLIEAFRAHLSAKRFQEAVDAKDIEILSLEHVRGLTFDHTLMIIDEAQNTSVHEMKALLTRLGEGSRVVLCGDHTQSDLRDAQSGLARAMLACDRGLVENVAHVAFSYEDSVRSARCAQWARAFDVLDSHDEQDRVEARHA